MLLKDECTLCKRVVSSSFLRRCYRCGKMYCIDCITFTKEGEVVCLNCARKMVSPRRLGTKYTFLSRYLLRRAVFTENATLPFAEIEGIIGDNLPMSALRDNEWWGNTRGSAQGRAWIDVGWIMQNVDLANRTVTFHRVASTKARLKEKDKKIGQTSFAKKTFRSVRTRKPKPPSKTKIAKVQARLRNIEREKLAVRQLRGKFKPRPAYEKQLYKPEAKPSQIKG